MECDVEGPCTWDATEKSLMKAPERKEERVMRDVEVGCDDGDTW
jgi:hypothetical protein